MAFCAVVSTGRYFIRHQDVMAVLPDGYTLHESEIECLANSMKVAGVQSRSDGRLVFYPRTFDTTGTARLFADAFEAKNGVKFEEQSDA